MTSKCEDLHTDENPDKENNERILQNKLLEQKELLHKLKSSLINSTENKNNIDIEFLLKRL